MDYEEIFASLPEKEKKKILDKKDYFRLKLQQVNIYEDFVTVDNSYDYITLEEKERCKIVADIFYENIENHIKSNTIINAIKQLIRQRGYHL